MRIRFPALLPALMLMLMIASISRAQESWPTRWWPIATPAAVGLAAKPIAELDAELTNGKYAYVDSMLVIRHGKIVYERSYQHDYGQIYKDDAKKPGPLVAHDPTGPYNYFNTWWHPFYHRGDLHTMQSVTKTMTSVVIGIAVGRKEFPDLDTPIIRFFNEKKVANLDDRKRRITVRHLLTMTAGLDWNEDLPYNDANNTAGPFEASYDWIRFVIDRPMAHEPGTVFQYSSGGAQLLSYIFERATGRDIEEYAADFLFTPLGMEYFWKRSPSGLIDTEGGLYLKPHDLAKVGLLFLKNGVWDGKQIVPSDWVKVSVTPAIAADSSRKYGFLWWLQPYGEGTSHLTWNALGFGGQRLIVIPEYDIVVVFTGWNILEAPALPNRVAIDRVVSAVQDARRSGTQH